MNKYPFVIIVGSQEMKDQILKESEYIHYLQEIDSDKAPFLMHLYLCDEAIQVVNSKNKSV